MSNDPILENWDNPAFTGPLRNGWTIERNVPSAHDSSYIVDKFTCPTLELTMEVNTGMTPGQLLSVGIVFSEGRVRGHKEGREAALAGVRKALGLES